MTKKTIHTHSPTGEAVPSKAGLTGDGVKPSITQGACPHTAPAASSMMVDGQQSDAPFVPTTAPHPSPPQAPHASLQQTVPSLMPGMPFAHVEGAARGENACFIEGG